MSIEYQNEQLQLLNALLNRHPCEFLPATTNKIAIQRLQDVLKYRNTVSRQNQQQFRSKMFVYQNMSGQHIYNNNNLHGENGRLLGLRGVQISVYDYTKYIKKQPVSNNMSFEMVCKYSDNLIEEFIAFGLDYDCIAGKKQRNSKLLESSILSNQQIRQYLQIGSQFDQIIRSQGSASNNKTKIILKLLSHTSHQSQILSKTHHSLQIMANIQTTNPYASVYIIVAEELTLLQKLLADQWKYFQININANQRNSIIKWQHVFKLFCAGTAGKKILNDYLFYGHEQTFYMLLKKYENIFAEQKHIFNQIQLRTLSTSLNQWLQDQNQTNIYQQAIIFMMDPFASLSENSKHRINKLHTILTPQTMHLFCLFTTLKWLKLSLYDIKLDNHQFYDLKVNNFCLIWEQMNLQIQCALPFRAISFIQKFGHKQKLVSVETLLLLSTMLSNQRYFEIMLMFDQFSQSPEITLQLQKVQTILKNHLITLAGNFQLHRLVLCFMVFISSMPMQVQILASSKSFVEFIDWEYLGRVFNNASYFKVIFEETIKLSIEKYDNAQKFINLEIPQYLKSSYYEINVLLQGLRSILTEGKKLSAPDKNNYFGIIQMFRGQIIPQEYHNSISLLQMLFEWFVIQQSIMKRDVRSIGVSMSAIFDDYKQNQVNNSFSVRLTDSMQFQSSAKFHNYEFLSRLWSQQFIKWLINFENGRNYYLFQGFLSALTDGLVLMKLNRRKAIKQKKLQKWIQSLTDNLQQIQNFMRGVFIKKFSVHRKIVLNQLLS